MVEYNYTDEDNVEYVPPNECFTGNSSGYAPGRWYSSRMSWALGVREGNIKLKPPPWWIEEQKVKGRTEGALFNIWHNRYDQARKISIWVMSPLEDFRRAGYLRRV